MGWREQATRMNEVIAEQVGESFTLTSADGSQTTALKGVYDRRHDAGELGGTEVRGPKPVVGIPEGQLPVWAEKDMTIDIREDRLLVTDLEPDGQGLVYLVCRPRV